MSAREAILRRVQASVAVGAAEDTRDKEVRAWIAARGGGPVPSQAQSAGTRRLDQFVAKLEAASASVSRISGLSELPHAVSHELRNRNLPAGLRIGDDRAFDGLDWGAVEVSRGTGRIEEPATLSRAEFGVAETGTLVLASGPDNPVTLTFLGETHFVVLSESDLCAGFEDFWSAWRGRGLDPRTINMVTGPSRSADIGQVLQLGAHGPVALHVFMVS